MKLQKYELTFTRYYGSNSFTSELGFLIGIYINTHNMVVLNYV